MLDARRRRRAWSRSRPGSCSASSTSSSTTLGLAMENLGDIDRQTLAGSISTGTHGTGARLRSVSAQVEAVELVLADGSVARARAPTPTRTRCARPGSGSARSGIVYAVTLRSRPRLHARPHRPAPAARRDARPLDELADANDHFEFYVFPHTDIALCRESRRTDEPPRPRGRAALSTRSEVMLENWARRRPRASRRAACRRRSRASPGSPRDGIGRLDQGRPQLPGLRHRAPGQVHRDGVRRSRASTRAEAVRRVLELRRAPSYRVAFPIEVRFAAADDAVLSPSHERDTSYIAVHQDRKLDWQPYFRGVEEIMDAYGGRPHWGKRHFQTAETLAPRYPRWDEFQAAARAARPRRRLRATSTREPRRSALEEGLALAAVGGRPRRRSRRPRPGTASRSARRARRPSRGAGRRGRRPAGRRPAAPSSGVCTSPAPSSRSSCRPAGSQGSGRRSSPAAPEAR